MFTNRHRRWRKRFAIAAVQPLPVRFHPSCGRRPPSRQYRADPPPASAPARLSEAPIGASPRYPNSHRSLPIPTHHSHGSQPLRYGHPDAPTHSTYMDIAARGIHIVPDYDPDADPWRTPEDPPVPQGAPSSTVTVTATSSAPSTSTPTPLPAPEWTRQVILRWPDPRNAQ